MARTTKSRSALQALMLLGAMAVPAALQAQQQLAAVVTQNADRVGSGLARGLLADARASAVYINPDAVPRFSASYSVTLNSRARAMQLDRIATGGKDLEEALQTALQQLDGQLRTSGSDRNKILQLDVFYAGKGFDNTMRLSNAVDQYFAGRMAYATSGRTSRADAKYVDYPVRPIIGVQKLENDALVAIQARILDPSTHTYADVTNPNVDFSPSGPLQVLIGGVTAMQRNFVVAGYGNNAVQTDAAIANLQHILDGVGMDRSGVTKVTAYYTAGVDPQMLRAKIRAHFGENVQVEDVQSEEACVPSASVLLNAEGVIK